MRLEFADLGTIEYTRAWRMQDELAAQIARGEREPTLLLLEHPHVYTFGRTGHAEHLLLSSEQLHARGINVHWVDRGGDVTYHGPGQLVGYPLIPLQSLAQPITPWKVGGGRAEALGVQGTAGRRVPAADHVGFVRLLERALIGALARLGLVAGQRKGYTGVWVQADVWSRCLRCRPENHGKPAKLAAIGIKIDARGISRHGFALNVNPDMSWWEGIVGCGLQDQPVAALSDLLSPVPSMARVKEAVIQAFTEAFGRGGPATLDWRQN